MPDSVLQLNPATLPGGKLEDVWELIGAGGQTVIRQRIQITGDTLAEVTRVLNVAPIGTEYGVVTRNIPSGTQDTNQTQVGGAGITLGQKLMTASYPVVIASDQSAIPVTFTPSGTQDVNLTQVSGVAVTLGQKLMAASFPVVLASDQSPVTVNQGTSPWVTSVSGNVTVDQGTSPWVVGGTVAVTQSTSPWVTSVTGNVTVDQGTSPWVISGAVTQGTSPWVENLTEVGGSAITLGQKLMAASFPVVIASDQSAIPVTFTPVATQDVNVTQWGGVATTLGQKPMAASVPVVLASDQSAVPVSGTVTSVPQTTSSGAPVGVVVTTAAILLKAANASRKSISITNNGTSNIFVGSTVGVTASGPAVGNKVAPNGTLTDQGDGLWTGDFYAIGDAVSVVENVSVWERI